MQLEKIELTGFKSFADKTVVEFDSGVTAVVGPNGSGKSNLSEAIKWVLGEQSARSLRGKKMDDVIFAGSETRKPVNLAEVQLYIDNQDHTLAVDQTQVVLTRRLNRKGESDYFINKKPCRLKDITDLMMDSGLGKDSFALISQGKVEQIFNNKPEERRQIIEEAAGVLKYKDRKHQAQRKLTQTQDHLNRVADIIHEIKGQLEPLEKQKEDAVYYLGKKQELTDVEISLLAVEIETLNTQWRLALKETEETAVMIQQLEKEKAELELKMQSEEQDNQLHEQSMETLQKNYVELIQLVEKLDGERRVLLQKREFTQRSDEENQKALQDSIRELENLEQEQQELKKQASVKQAEAKIVQETWNQTVAQLEQLTKGDEHQLEEFQSDYIAALQEESRLKNQERHLEKNMEMSQTMRDRMMERMDQVTEEQAGLQEHVNQHIHSKEQSEKRIENLKKTLADKQVQVQEISQKKEDAFQLFDQKQKTLQQLEANYRSLKHISEDYAGYYSGARHILKHKASLSGVVGAVAELITVPDTYTIAIDTALGATSQHIVVKNEQAATKAIQFLKESRSGRATFLPLTVIQGRQIPAAILKSVQANQGFLGVASQVISYQSIYQEIIGNLLGATIVADSLTHAQEMAKKIQYRYRIVTLEGDVVNAGGSMTGGATGNKEQHSLVRRAAKLQEVEKEVAQLQKELATYRKRFEQMNQDWQVLSQEIQGLEAEQLEASQTLQEANFALTLLAEKEMNLRKQEQSLSFELEQQSEEYDQLEQQYIECSSQLKEIAKQVKTIKQEMELLQLSQGEKDRKIQDLREQLQVVGTEKALTEEKYQQCLNETKQLERQMQRLQDQIRLLTDRKTEHHESQTLDQTSLEKLDRDYKEQADKLNDIQVMLEEAKKSKAKRELISKEHEISRNQLIKQLQHSYQEQGKRETKANRFEMLIDQKLNYLSEEYELTFEAASRKPPLEMSIEEAGKLVRQLKKDLEQMGSVNLMAIEEYDKVSERYEFLSKQESDLLQAKQTLEETIDEMDSEVKSRFKETFDAVQHQFERTFPRLFGGGKATLVLTQPDDLLETGIEIIAQPPGKKLQSLSLLSGGERSFTAIALLFAILEVKPVPFCLLDEVEAALDDANVARYGRYLHEFTKETQFIVITHRRGTMEEADVLYGVTMQDSGVSRLASVKFEDYEQEIVEPA